MCLVRLLLEQESISFNILNHGDMTLLAQKAAEGSVRIMKLILKQKPSYVNAAKQGNPTQLGLVAENDHIKVVKKLLTILKSTSMKHTSAGQRHSAAQKGCAKVVGLSIRNSRIQSNCGHCDESVVL